MKKFYVKPVATNIAFVVNENIATSKNPDTSLTGLGSYANVVANCNEFFNSTQIKTYLEPGQTSILQAFANVQKNEPEKLQEIMDKMNPLTGDFNCY
jgi:hypothetical protein